MKNEQDPLARPTRVPRSTSEHLTNKPVNSLGSIAKKSLLIIKQNIKDLRYPHVRTLPMHLDVYLASNQISGRVTHPRSPVVNRDSMLMPSPASLCKVDARKSYHSEAEKCIEILLQIGVPGWQTLEHRLNTARRICHSGRRSVITKGDVLQGSRKQK